MDRKIMENSENQEIGELLAGIVKNGFSVGIFQRWKIEIGKTVEIGKDEHSGEILDPSTTPNPKTYIAIQSNELRMTPELNQRLLKADTLVEALRKAAKVAQYIVDSSDPIQ